MGSWSTLHSNGTRSDKFPIAFLWCGRVPTGIDDHEWSQLMLFIYRIGAVIDWVLFILSNVLVHKLCRSSHPRKATFEHSTQRPTKISTSLRQRKKLSHEVCHHLPIRSRVRFRCWGHTSMLSRPNRRRNRHLWRHQTRSRQAGGDNLKCSRGGPSHANATTVSMCVHVGVECWASMSISSWVLGDGQAMPMWAENVLLLNHDVPNMSVVSRSGEGAGSW